MMTAGATWLIDEPSPAAPIEVLEQWLFDCDLKIENARDDGERAALMKAHASVLKSLRMRRGSGLGERMDPAGL